MRIYIKSRIQLVFGTEDSMYYILGLQKCGILVFCTPCFRDVGRSDVPGQACEGAEDDRSYQLPYRVYILKYPLVLGMKAF